MPGGPRLTIAPTRTILALLASEWPLDVPRHRLMRIGMQVGLQALADLEPEAFRRVVVDDAISSAGIRER